ncbi:hypothetical protein AWB79_07502 [Caballeronia hypogeia]|uniref:Uncharacterized protein n=1 Tax=Caballeronia hypogeia TaxID=1777140 RepID=A0A158DU25_9BURK|nr:hypothetical protein [Caballeronia hypogeia]SAK97686.1 hypothetical protein AWB79_07502 [Caballeronia hypogeia]
MLLIKALIYKPIGGYWLGEIGFLQMVFQVLTRWCLIMAIALAVIFAYIATAPGVMTGKFGAKNHEAEDRAAREAAFQERKLQRSTLR